MAARPILTSFVACAITATASASPRTDPTSGRAVFTGATVPNATAIGLNPAALGLGTVGEVLVTLASVADHYRIAPRSANGELTGAQVRDLVPSYGGAVAVVLRAGERSTVGFELKSQPAEQLGPPSAELRYAMFGGRQRDYSATISATFHVTSVLYFGASLTHAHARLRMRYSLDAAARHGEGPGGITSDCGGAPCGAGNPLARESYDIDVSSPLIATSNLKLNLGLVLRLAQDVWLGLAYHTPPGFAIQSELDGAGEIRRATRDGGGVLQAGSTVYISYPASVDAELRARLPRQLDLHVGARWEDLSRFQAYDVRVYGSKLPAANIPEWTLRPRGLHDAFSLWAGLEQIDIGQRVRGGGRIGLESSSLDDARTTAYTIAPTSLTLDAGVQLRLAPSWTMQLTYGLQYFPEVSVTDSAFSPDFQVACVASGYDYSTPACQAVREGYAIPTQNGDYTRLQHAGRLVFRYELP